MAVREPANFGVQMLSLDSVRLILDGTIQAVRLVVRVSSFAAINDHLAITSVVVTHGCSVGAVDRYLVIIFSKSVSVSIGIVDKSAL